MISIITGQDQISEYFDIHTEQEGEMDFVITTLNAVCPGVLDDWKHGENDPCFSNSDHDRWEIVWCIDDTKGWPLANKIYSYIETFGFDVKIIEEKGQSW